MKKHSSVATHIGRSRHLASHGTCASRQSLHCPTFRHPGGRLHIAGGLALAMAASPCSAGALKSDLQHAVLVSALAALPAAGASTGAPVDISLGAGYREDTLNWNISGGSTVNIMSELQWENLEIAQLKAALKFNFKNDWRLRATGGYGAINSGTNQDSDYAGNNRTLEYSRSNNQAGGDVADASIGLGKTLRLLDQTAGKFMVITPFVGLSMHQQNLTMSDGFQTLATAGITPPLGSFPGLASSYDTQWQGPWAGIDILLETGGDLSLIAAAEYHLADYSAQANWNLRDDFAHPVSFRHTAKGQGWLLAAGGSYALAKNWIINLTLEHQKWSTRAGNDVTYFSDGSAGYTRLNEVNWESTAYNLGIVYSFGNL